MHVSDDTLRGWLINDLEVWIDTLALGESIVDAATERFSRMPTLEECQGLWYEYLEHMGSSVKDGNLD